VNNPENVGLSGEFPTLNSEFIGFYAYLLHFSISLYSYIRFSGMGIVSGADVQYSFTKLTFY
jgi:hypothetical protein